ncbi:hypothetical protein EC968_001392 [Mortierella alpina]|nr:hypothetical protein EC968_001392 [Mortierella alpina]
MEHDNAGMDYLKVDHPQSTSTDTILQDPLPAPRERSGSDSPKAHVDICALFVFGISASFVYVNGLVLLGHVTSKPTARPLDKYYSRSAEFLHLEADTLHRRVDYVTDSLNVVLTELAKVVLIEDNKRSLKFIGIFYTIWTLRTWFSTTTLLSMILVSLFAAPRIYLDNQQVIDTHLAQTNNIVQAHVGKGCQMAQEKWTNVYTKAEHFAHEKGLLKKTETKQE